MPGPNCRFQMPAFSWVANWALRVNPDILGPSDSVAQFARVPHFEEPNLLGGGQHLVHYYTLSLCYLGAETDDQHRNPNTNTEIIWWATEGNHPFKTQKNSLV